MVVIRAAGRVRIQGARPRFESRWTPEKSIRLWLAYLQEPFGRRSTRSGNTRRRWPKYFAGGAFLAVCEGLLCRAATPACGACRRAIRWSQRRSDPCSRRICLAVGRAFFWASERFPIDPKTDFLALRPSRKRISTCKDLFDWFLKTVTARN